MKKELASARRGKRRMGGTAFLVRIRFTENSTWQGTIQWLDGRKTKNFRIFLEMAMLMSAAVNYEKNSRSIACRQLG